MPTDQELRDYYSNLNDERLLKLAAERSSLTDRARLALDEALGRRNFTEAEISSLLDEPTLWEMQAAGLPIAHRVNGCGTTLIGRREERADGSYVTEKWITVFFLPIYRVATIRIREVILPGGSMGYVIEK
jgi:hypothetical protein